MSDEKIDLAPLERELHACMGSYFETENVAELLALVAAVRAAIMYRESGFLQDRMRLDDALENIVDSAEARSDGE